MDCSFESSSWESDYSCGLSQLTNDRFDWTRMSGPTSSSSTGPSFASDGRYYLYIEATSAAVNDNAVLMSKTLNTSKFFNKKFLVNNMDLFLMIQRTEKNGFPHLILVASGGCLRFDYHMYGYYINILNVNVSTVENGTQRLWWRYGNQGNLWLQATIPLPRSSSLRVC